MTSGLRGDILDRVADSGSFAVEAYEQKKRSHLSTEALCSQEGFSFVPMVVEAHGGGWGLVARRALSNLAQRAATTGGSTAVVADQLTQRLSCLLQKENARAVVRRLQGWTASEDAASLEAAPLLCPG